MSKHTVERSAHISKIFREHMKSTTNVLTQLGMKIQAHTQPSVLFKLKYVIFFVAVVNIFSIDSFSERMEER